LAENSQPVPIDRRQALRQALAFVFGGAVTGGMLTASMGGGGGAGGGTDLFSNLVPNAKNTKVGDWHYETDSQFHIGQVKTGRFTISPTTAFGQAIPEGNQRPYNNYWENGIYSGLNQISSFNSQGNLTTRGLGVSYLGVVLADNIDGDITNVPVNDDFVGYFINNNYGGNGKLQFGTKRVIDYFGKSFVGLVNTAPPSHIGYLRASLGADTPTIAENVSFESESIPSGTAKIGYRQKGSANNNRYEGGASFGKLTAPNASVDATGASGAVMKALNKNVIVLESVSETDVTGTTTNATAKTYALPANSYTRVIVEAEISLVGVAATDNEVKYDLKIDGTNIDDTVSLRQANTGAGDQFKLAGCLKASKVQQGAVTITISVTAVLGAGTWTVRSLRVYGEV